VRDYALFNLINYHLQENGVVGFEKYYDYFRKHNTDPHYAAELKKVYEKRQLVAPGKPAPSFTLNDVDGKQISLEDYKGKYVLIDFWQTLCSRSARELPHYMELYDDYQDENIAFVSISIDQDENKWRDYVKEKKNVGTSLRALDYFDSEVYQNFQVQGLPSFILIDKDGNIIEPVAPKPSTQEMRDKLDAVLNK
jgi:peroxiredoxin